MKAYLLATGLLSFGCSAGSESARSESAPPSGSTGAPPGQPGPAGPQGERGPAGEKGDRGPAGPRGGGTVWKDANGTVIPVMALVERTGRDGFGAPTMALVPDSSGI